MGARRLGCVLCFVLLLGMTACGLVQPAAQYDPVIENSVSDFDKAFQTFVIELNRTAGTPEGRYEHHQDFYAKWGGELAALRNRAIASDPADACPMSGAVAEAFTVLAQTTGEAGDTLLAGTGRVENLVTAAHGRVEERLREALARLHMPAGSLSPDQLEALEQEVAALQKKRDRLRIVSAEMSETTVPEPEGGCATIVVSKLEQQFDAFERVHEAQGEIGLPARARAPVILMNVTIQNVLKMEAVKRQKAARGLL